MFREAAPLLVLLAFGQVYYRQDTLLLRWLTNERQVGLYAAAYRLFDMFVFVPGSLALAYLPAASVARGRGSGEFEALFKRSVLLALTLALPIAIGFSARGPGVISLLFGPGFAEAAPAARVVVWAAIFYFVNWILAYTLLALGRQSISAWAAVVGTVANAGLNLALIPRLGIVGAAVSTVATEALMFAVQAKALSELLQQVGKPRDLLGILLASGAMGGVMWATHSLPTLVALALGGATFLVVAVTLGSFKVAEIRGIFRARAEG